MVEFLYGNAGENNVANGTQPPLAANRQGALLADALHGRYTEQARRGRLFWARAVVTAPVIFSTAAGTGGPLLYNGTNTASGVNAALLGVGIAITTASAVSGALGIGVGATTAPTSTTAIDSTTNALVGGSASQCSAYRVGTPSAAASQFIPFAQVHTGAVTVDTAAFQWIDLGGSIVVPPGYFASICASATLTSAVLQVSLLWEEIPV